MSQAATPSTQIVTSGYPGQSSVDWPQSSEMWLDVGQESAGFNFRKFLHSLRRSWLPAVLSGLVLATTMAGILWFLIPERYEARALVRVNVANRGVFDRSAGLVNEREYAIYKETQASLVKSQFVLSRALRDDSIRQLPMLQRSEAPETFLTRELQVSYQRRSELLQISLWGSNREELKQIVNAITDAYLAEARLMEERTIAARLQLLQGQKESNLKRMREESEAIRRLSDKVGSADPEKLKVQQLIETQQLAGISKARDELQKDLGDLEAQFIIISNARQTQGFNPSPNQVVDLLESDPTYMAYKQQVNQIEAELAAAQGSMRPGSMMEMRAAAQLESLKGMMKQRELELRPRIVEKIKASYGLDDTMQTMQLRELRIQLELKQRKLAEVEKAHEEQLVRIGELFGTHEELITRQAELKNLEEGTAEIAGQITNEELLMRSPRRVERLQSAEIPEEGNVWLRLLGIVAASVGTFIATVLGFAMTDYSRNVMSSPYELQRETNLPVLGKLPPLQDQVRGLFGGGRGDRASQMSNCVDSIRAALTRGDKSNEVDSVMITSAVGREGKSLFASQLAVSMARNGKKTVLVDGDIRSPRLHQIFGMPANRGLCEVLLGEVPLEDVVQATPSANLWILPAGVCEDGTNQALSGEAISAVLSQLRSQFDFVVVDCAPVLTGPEAMVFGQYVSGVVFAARQDFSSIDKIDEAQRCLRSVGIRVLGAVINGAHTDSRGRRLALSAK